MNISMPYGAGTVEGSVPWARHLATLDIGDIPALPDLGAAARETFNRPIGMDTPLGECVQPGERVAIIVSDSFRQTAIHQILPDLLEVLNGRGIADEDILFVYATGTHRGPTEDEECKILGAEVYDRFRGRTLAHDPHDESKLVFRGETSRGTRVFFNRQVLECDRVIVTGTVVLHYFGGFGGGRKSVLPGIAGASTIAQNHARNLHATRNELDPAVRIGEMTGNPVAEDMLEGARLCPVHFLVNTVLNRNGEIAGLFAGELDAAHTAAAAFARELYAVPIEEQADIVVASAGGAKNFIQSHKALFNAFQALKPGGRIVFLAPAPEGFGGNKFSQWLSLGTREAIISELRKNAEINGQTALSTREKAPHSFFVTELREEEVALLGGCKAANLSDALERARAALAARGISQPSITLMPSASYTVPIVTRRTV